MRVSSRGFWKKTVTIEVPLGAPERVPRGAVQRKEVHRITFHTSGAIVLHDHPDFRVSAVRALAAVDLTAASAATEACVCTRLLMDMSTRGRELTGTYWGALRRQRNGHKTRRDSYRIQAEDVWRLPTEAIQYLHLYTKHLANKVRCTRTGQDEYARRQLVARLRSFSAIRRDKLKNAIENAHSDLYQRLWWTYKVD